MAEFHDESFKANWRNTGTLKRTGCMSCSWLYSPSNSWLSRKVCRKSDRRPNQDARICALSSTFSLVVSASGNKSYCGVRGGQLTMYRSQSTCKCPCHPLSPDELARIDPVVEGRLGTPLPPSVAPSIVISGPAQRRGSAQLASKVHRESPSNLSRGWQRFASNSQRFLPAIPSDYQRFYQRISW